LQVDPSEASAATQGRPQSFNLYAYVQNDPTNSADPLGLAEYELDCFYVGEESQCVPLYPNPETILVNQGPGPQDQPPPESITGGVGLLPGSGPGAVLRRVLGRVIQGTIPPPRPVDPAPGAGQRYPGQQNPQGQGQKDPQDKRKPQDKGTPTTGTPAGVGAAVTGWVRRWQLDADTYRTIGIVVFIAFSGAAIIATGGGAAPAVAVIAAEGGIAAPILFPIFGQ